MEKAILGTKIGMTQIFGEGGVVIPVTVVMAGVFPFFKKLHRRRLLKQTATKLYRLVLVTLKKSTLTNHN